MCHGCWTDHGAPRIDTPRVRAIQALLLEVYDGHCAGGHLHIAVDDWNLEDENLTFCYEAIAEAWFLDDDTAEQLRVEQACCEALMAMPFEERLSALAIFGGFWSPLQEGLPDVHTAGQPERR